MKPSHLAQALVTMIQAREPVFIWGPPGIGKSQIVRQVSDSLYSADYGYTVDMEGNAFGLDGEKTATRPWLADIRAVLLDPVDLRGLPHVNGGGHATWAIPDFLPRIGKGILFLDEINRAPVLVQNACLQLVLDRRIGEYVLPDGWAIMAAGNRESDGGGVTRMNSALASRFVHLDAETDLNDWSKWAVRANIHPATLGFIRFRPELLHQFDRTARAFPAPRTWEFVSNVTKQSPPNYLSHPLFSGSVGEGAAVEYSAFLDMYKSLVSIDQILLSPKGTPVPTTPSALYAVCSALARVATDSNLARVVQYLDRCPQEFAVMCVKDAVERTPAIASCPDFTRWAVEHSEHIF
jgi:hypothetical protein